MKYLFRMIHNDDTKDDGDNGEGDYVKWEESLPKPLFKMGTSDTTIEAFFADDDKVQLMCALGWYLHSANEILSLIIWGL